MDRNHKYLGCGFGTHISFAAHIQVLIVQAFFIGSLVRYNHSQYNC